MAIEKSPTLIVRSEHTQALKHSGNNEIRNIWQFCTQNFLIGAVSVASGIFI